MAALWTIKRRRGAPTQGPEYDVSDQLIGDVRAASGCDCVIPVYADNGRNDGWKRELKAVAYLPATGGVIDFITGSFWMMEDGQLQSFQGLQALLNYNNLKHSTGQPFTSPWTIHELQLLVYAAPSVKQGAANAVPQGRWVFVDEVHSWPSGLQLTEASAHKAGAWRILFSHTFEVFLAAAWFFSSCMDSADISCAAAGAAAAAACSHVR
jgi:hypothetical protein